MNNRIVKIRATKCICALCKQQHENSAAARAKHRKICQAKPVAHAARGRRNQ